MSKNISVSSMVIFYISCVLCNSEVPSLSVAYLIHETLLCIGPQCHQTLHIMATQNNGDSAALMKRVPASVDIIKARFGPEIVPPLLVVTAIVAAITLSILVWVEGDDPVRGNGVEFFVEHSDQKSSARNVNRLPKILSARWYRSIHTTTGLFVTPPIPPHLMELRARTMVTPITN